MILETELPVPSSGAPPAQRQILDAGRQRVAGEGEHQIDARLRNQEGFGNGIAGIIDEIGVVARATRHLVGAEAAVELVVAGAADQDIVLGAALKIIVALAAFERVGTLAADQDVVAAQAPDMIAVGAAIDRVVGFEGLEDVVKPRQLPGLDRVESVPSDVSKSVSNAAGRGEAGYVDDVPVYGIGV